MKHFLIQDSKMGFYAVDEYAPSKQEALNQYRNRWYPERSRLPAGVSIWLA